MRRHPLGPPMSPSASQRRTAPRKLPCPRSPSGGCKVSVDAQPCWLQGARRRAVQGPRSVGQGPEATHKGTCPRQSRVSRTAAQKMCGWGGAGFRSPARPGPDLDSQPKTPPRPSPCRALTDSSNLWLPADPALRPSLPGARRGRLRSAAPAPRRCPQVPERGGRGVPRAHCKGRFAGPRVGAVRGADPLGPAISPRDSPRAPRVARAQSGPSQLLGSPSRPIRPQIFPLVRRPGAAQQPAPIGRARGDASFPLGHHNVRPDRYRSPCRAAKAGHLPGPLLRWRSGPRGRSLPSSLPPSRTSPGRRAPSRSWKD